MDFETQRVMREWNNDVNAEIRRLIKKGVPPWQAADQARDNVSRDRGEKHIRRQLSPNT